MCTLNDKMEIVNDVKCVCVCWVDVCVLGSVDTKAEVQVTIRQPAAVGSLVVSRERERVQSDLLPVFDPSVTASASIATLLACLDASMPFCSSRNLRSCLRGTSTRSELSDIVFACLSSSSSAFLLSTLRFLLSFYLGQGDLHDTLKCSCTQRCVSSV